jgi:hypothetical protein
MRTPSAAVMVVDMAATRVCLIIELEPGEPICGSGEIDGEAPVAFEGMLGLLSLLERVRERAPSVQESLTDGGGGPGSSRSADAAARTRT